MAAHMVPRTRAHMVPQMTAQRNLEWQRKDLECAVFRGPFALSFEVPGTMFAPIRDPWGKNPKPKLPSLGCL